MVAILMQGRSCRRWQAAGPKWVRARAKPIRLFITRRVPRRVANSVTIVSDFRNRSAHRSHAGFTERHRFAGAVIAPQTLWNADERKPDATRRPARNAIGRHLTNWRPASPAD